jgi:argininosuccinate lyase
LIHVQALVYTKVLTNAEAGKLNAVLKDILCQVEKGVFVYNPDSEDIHTEIQNRLEAKVKDAALKLHSFRSRNDMVAFDERFYCYEQASEILGLLADINNNAIPQLAGKYPKEHIAGYTHTQRAQVVSFAEYINSFAFMLHADFKRIYGFKQNLKVSLGAGALAGSFIKKSDYDRAIKNILNKAGFINTAENSLHNVSSRDFMIEFMGALAILQMHLSRMAEDMILYSTREFDFLDLPEEFCTGSSLMPHKKNPDFLELVRGYSGRIYGNLVSILTTMKGLPLTYNRDMQLDKEPLFSSVETIKDELKILAKFIPGIKLNKAAVNKALEDESLYATELAEYLVNKGVAFKTAHEIVGKLIRYAEDKKIKIKDINDSALKVFSAHLNNRVIKKVFDPVFAAASKRSIKRK